VILNRYNWIFFTLLFFHTVVLLYLTNEFSISFKEADIFFNGDVSLLTIITNFSTNIFGQNDFALLFIDASLQPNDTLPTSFPFIPPNVEENIFNDFPFFLAGYAVDTLNTQLYVNTNLFASSVSVPLQSVYAFKDTNNIDLLFFAGTAITRVGSSGGAVVRATDGTLQGVITALTTETETKDRTLIAISLSHINRSIFEETGNTLREFIDSYDDDIVILNN